jgi:hypothetical protein
MIAAATPEPMLRWLSPQQGGFMGHVLGGVGDVGSILSTVVGKPVKAPRMELSDLAAASKLRSGHAAELAKKRLGEVILDPKSTKRQIAEAAVAAGSTDQALRLVRGDEDGRPPASILGLRSAIEAMDPDDPRRPQYQRALDAQLEYQRQQAELEDKRTRERQPPHYDPAESYRLRHEAERTARDKEAQDAGYKPGTPEYKYYMSYGHPPLERQPPPPTTLDQEIDKETRRRNNLLGKPGQPKRLEDFPEPVETTARRNLANRQKAAAAEKSGEPLPPPPPPKPKRGAAAGGLIGEMLGGTPSETPPPTITPSSTPPMSTTSTTQPPAAGSSDADADAILGSIDWESLPPDVQKQVQAAAAAGMPKWPLANWLLSLQPQGPPRPPGP